MIYLTARVKTTKNFKYRFYFSVKSSTMLQNAKLEMLDFLNDFHLSLHQLTFANKKPKKTNNIIIKLGL